MKFFKQIITNINKFTILFATVILASLLVVSSTQAADPDVVFNNGEGIQGIGSERDFLRINDAGGGNTAELCEDGKTVDLWFYVHNTNPTILNGANYDGVGVAKNTVVDLDFQNTGYSKSHTVSAKVTADNAAVSTDGVTINCGSREIKLEYVSQSVTQDANAPAGVNYTMTGNIMDGAKLGYNNGSNSVFPGCFEYRAYIKVKVKVTVKEEPKLNPAICTLLEAAVIDKKKVRVSNVQFTANDATVNNITLDYGDGKTETVTDKQFPVEHTYEKAGTYTVRATLNTTFQGQAKAVTSDNCAKRITINEEETPFYVCEGFKLTINNRTVNVQFTVKAGNGAKFENASIAYSADGAVKQTALTNQIDGNGVVKNSYTFAEGAKNIKAEATVAFTVNGQKKEVKCSGTGVLGTTTKNCPIPGMQHLPADSKDCVLPRTGAGSIAGLMATVTVAGTALHRRMTLRKNR